MTTFRNDLDAAHARIESLERDNRELREAAKRPEASPTDRLARLEQENRRLRDDNEASAVALRMLMTPRAPLSSVLASRIAVRRTGALLIQLTLWLVIVVAFATTLT